MYTLPSPPFPINAVMCETLGLEDRKLYGSWGHGGSMGHGCTCDGHRFVT